VLAITVEATERSLTSLGCMSPEVTQSDQCADARSGLVLFSPGPVTGCDGLYWGFLGDEDDLVSQVDEESNAR
jgi:hypothetical protein